jgi:hypothetical protein
MTNRTPSRHLIRFRSRQVESRERRCTGNASPSCGRWLRVIARIESSRSRCFFQVPQTILHERGFGFDFCGEEFPDRPGRIGILTRLFRSYRVRGMGFTSARQPLGRVENPAEDGGVARSRLPSGLSRSALSSFRRENLPF